MTKPPVFLAAFANSEDSWLPNLIQEEQNVRETLSVLHDANRMEFLVLGRTGIDDIYREFNRFYGRIQVFHFSGHTDPGFLELVDQSHRASSLANLISMEKQLKLVVLNGCANKDQVFALLDAGVGAVIATKTPIRDDKATVFSAQFYRAMISGKTVKEAFLTATEYLKDTHEGFHDDVAIRGIDKEDDVQLVPWGLYYREEAGTAWCFPKAGVGQQDSTDSIRSGSKKKQYSKKYAITVNRSKQKDEFVKSTQKIKNDKLNFFFVHGDHRQLFQKMVERFEWERVAFPNPQVSPEIPDSAIINIIVDNTKNKELFLYYFRKQLLTFLKCSHDKIEKYRSLAGFVSGEAHLFTNRGDNSVFVVCDILEASWDDDLTPNAIQYFIDQFLSSPKLPNHSPDFYFFFGVHYEKEIVQERKWDIGWNFQFLKKSSIQQDVAVRITNVMKNHELVKKGIITLLPELEPPTTNDIILWFQNNIYLVPDGDTHVTYAQKFIKNIRDNYKYMTDLLRELGKVIENYNEDKFL
jgi:hypothetical protein